MTSSQKHAAPIVLNYLTAPNVVIWYFRIEMVPLLFFSPFNRVCYRSAVLASSAIPMVLNPVVLHSKDEDGQVKPYFAFGNCWYDGSIKNDLPMAQISEMFNVNYFIVSQWYVPHLFAMYSY
jgi:TAG lipase/steryl ester hydrolase/phospholipase A2/LPA acyltransferase